MNDQISELFKAHNSLRDSLTQHTPNTGHGTHNMALLKLHKENSSAAATRGLTSCDEVKPLTDLKRQTITRKAL